MNTEDYKTKVHQELEKESSKHSIPNLKKNIQTTLVIETDLHHAIQEIGLKRRRMGIKPYTLTGIIKEALRGIVAKED